MQMNKPVWIVEDKALKDSEEGRKKLQQVADDHDKPNTASRLTIVHGEDFDKVILPDIACVIACYRPSMNISRDKVHWQFQAD